MDASTHSSSCPRPLRRPEFFHSRFDLGSIYRRAGSDLRYHAALPGLLVGAGLLFTFLGLAVGLSAASDVVAEGVDQLRRNAALRDLLGAASVKFVTSLVGLFLSIMYALFRKSQLRAAERAQATLLDALGERLPLRLFDARPQLIKPLWKKAPSLLGVFAARDHRCDAACACCCAVGLAIVSLVGNRNARADFGADVERRLELCAVADLASGQVEV